MRELEVLLSFTVPLEAVQAGEVVNQSQWVSRLQSSAGSQSSEGIWGAIHITCENVMQRMQL